MSYLISLICNRCNKAVVVQTVHVIPYPVTVGDDRGALLKGWTMGKPSGASYITRHYCPECSKMPGGVSA